MKKIYRGFVHLLSPPDKDGVFILALVNAREIGGDDRWKIKKDMMLEVQLASPGEVLAELPSGNCVPVHERTKTEAG